MFIGVFVLGQIVLKLLGVVICASYLMLFNLGLWKIWIMDYILYFL